MPDDRFYLLSFDNSEVVGTSTSKMNSPNVLLNITAMRCVLRNQKRAAVKKYEDLATGSDMTFDAGFALTDKAIPDQVAA